MRVFAISDLHLSFTADKPMDIFGEHWEGHFDRIKEDWHNKVSEEDIVVVAGDLSWAMDYEAAQPDIAAICQLPGHKILIKGNHDYWHSSLNRTRQMLFNNTYFLQNDVVQIGPYIFAGTRGWKQRNTEGFDAADEKIYQREVGRLEMSLQATQGCAGRLIGISHYPPFSLQRGQTEVTELYTAYNAQKVIYGHMHGIQLQKANIAEVTVKDSCYYLTSCDFLDFQLKLIDAI